MANFRQHNQPKLTEVKEKDTNHQKVILGEFKSRVALRKKMTFVID